MYTEVFFRAHLKRDAPPELLDWFDHIANGDDTIVEGKPDPWQPFDDHPFFDKARDWERVFCSGGAVYQISRRVQFRRSTTSYEYSELICHASAKYVPIDEFVDWISPWLLESPGDFLGYSLYEDSRPDGWYDKGPDQERPRLLFVPERAAVRP
jgi:hypothetical protein